MRVVVLGASGVIGQHMRLRAPAGIEATYCRRLADPLHEGADLTNIGALRVLSAKQPSVIVNLAGENRPDVVEQDPTRHYALNVSVPAWLAIYCDEVGAHYVHVSSQAVFSGEEPPYWASSPTEPINEYGRQKLAAEIEISKQEHWTIVRPTFVLGVRPLPHVGRANPLEQMLAEKEQQQVDDRWLSPLFARDAADQIWRIVRDRPRREVIHLGIPDRVSRYDLARAANPSATIQPVRHDVAFPDLAPRPKDTTYASDARYGEDIHLGLTLCRLEYDSRIEASTIQRATEIALFLDANVDECRERLRTGFGVLHAAVALDFRTANPQGDEELLDWYRRTESYIWELSAYHCDPGFNYAGLCEGIAERLRAAKAPRVLCLGDGIGGLTLALHKAGFDAVYHDLAGSRTAEFAAFRYWVQTGYSMEAVLTDGWSPDIGGDYDAIVSLDFLEHVVNVEEWATEIKGALRPGGLFFAQNAFAIGSGPNGSIPMHLTENDRFEHDWLPLLASLGMEAMDSNWFKRVA